MTTRLFAYGVLMYPRAVKALLGRTFKQKSAHLPSYKRLALQMLGYERIAGIMPVDAGLAQQQHVSGYVLNGLNTRSWRILDVFEGVHVGLYQRRKVTVIDANGKPLRAYAYVLGARGKRFTDGDWDVNAFTQHEMQRYYHHIIPRFVKRHPELYDDEIQR